jgi:integrase
VFRQVDRHGRLLGGRMSGRAAAERVKVRCRAAGYDPARYSGHSLRRGFITAAATAGALERDIMRHSRHKSVAVFRGYIEAATVFDANAATVVGL